jgi:hypothetical protein
MKTFVYSVTQLPLQMCLYFFTTKFGEQKICRWEKTFSYSILFSFDDIALFTPSSKTTNLRHGGIRYHGGDDTTRPRRQEQDGQHLFGVSRCGSVVK